LAIPFSDENFDVVSCYEVLEHLPYSEFSNALKEIHRVSRQYAILSLPDITTIYKIHLELPIIRPIRKLIIHPFHKPENHIFDGEHYWEIGKISYSLEKIEVDIQQAGLNIINTFRLFEFTYHRFFVLNKR
jgi:ubiquinone/menaquinone biosynthesis C-methylase UbiE